MLAEITPKQVMELRQRTGVGMMECKKALAEANGDLEAAAGLMNVKPQVLQRKMKKLGLV